MTYYIYIFYITFLAYFQHNRDVSLEIQQFSFGSVTVYKKPSIVLAKQL